MEMRVACKTLPRCRSACPACSARCPDGSRIRWGRCISSHAIWRAPSLGCCAARETAERRARHNAHALNELNRNSVTDTAELARWAGVEHLLELSGQLYLFRNKSHYEQDKLGKVGF
jgi:hypothetical protein